MPPPQLLGHADRPGKERPPARHQQGFTLKPCSLLKISLSRDKMSRTASTPVDGRAPDDNRLAAERQGRANTHTLFASSDWKSAASLHPEPLRWRRAGAVLPAAAQRASRRGPTSPLRDHPVGGGRLRRHLHAHHDDASGQGAQRQYRHREQAGRGQLDRHGQHQARAPRTARPSATATSTR